MAVLCGMPTIYGSKRSAYGGIHGHLNLKIQTAFWDTNDILWNQSLMAFRKWNCNFPTPDALLQPKHKFQRRKRHFRKKHCLETKTTFQVWIVKLLTSNSIEMENLFVEERWVLGISSWLLCTTKLVSHAVQWPSFSLFHWMTCHLWAWSHDVNSQAHLDRQRCGVLSMGVQWTSQRIWRSFLVRIAQARGMALNWFQ